MSGLNFTQQIRHVCGDMVARLPELGHIDLSRVAISFAQTRNNSRYGMYASLTPLRFEGGDPTTVRHGRTYRVQRMRDANGQELLYILSFYLPRFLDLEFREKLITVLHELWHISPEFNGDIRRHPGRCFAHSHSKAEYDAEMGQLADRWLATGPPPELYAFLGFRFNELVAHHQRVFGTRIRRPKLLRHDER